MNFKLSPKRVGQVLAKAAKSRILVIGDVMLDHFIWGTVARISPEAPVPVVDFERESLMPGGAANVARNLTALDAPTELFGVLGRDLAAQQLKSLLKSHHIGCDGLISNAVRATSVKTRIVAQTQQVVRIDRETRDGIDGPITRRLLSSLEPLLAQTSAVIVGDYGKGMDRDSARQPCIGISVAVLLHTPVLFPHDLHTYQKISQKQQFPCQGANIPPHLKQEDESGD